MAHRQKDGVGEDKTMRGTFLPSGYEVPDPEFHESSKHGQTLPRRLTALLRFGKPFPRMNHLQYGLWSTYLIEEQNRICDAAAIFLFIGSLRNSTQPFRSADSDPKAEPHFCASRVSQTLRLRPQHYRLWSRCQRVRACEIRWTHRQTRAARLENQLQHKG